MSEEETPLEIPTPPDTDPDLDIDPGPRKTGRPKRGPKRLVNIGPDERFRIAGDFMEGMPHSMIRAKYKVSDFVFQKLRAVMELDKAKSQYEDAVTAAKLQAHTESTAILKKADVYRSMKEMLSDVLSDAWKEWQIYKTRLDFRWRNPAELVQAITKLADTISRIDDEDKQIDHKVEFVITGQRPVDQVAPARPALTEGVIDTEVVPETPAT